MRFRFKYLLYFATFFVISNSFAAEKIVLTSGWNLISIPVSETIKQSAYTAKFGEHEMIYAYKNRAWTKDPDSIAYGEGFWIKSSQDQTIEFEGISYDVTDTFSSLEQGLYLLGSGQEHQELLETYGFDAIFTFTDGEWTKNPETIEVGQGFWVMVGDSFVIPEDENETELYEALSNSGAETATSIEDASLDVNSSVDTVLEVSTTEYTLNKTLQEAQEDQNKSFFLDGEFLGMVESVSGQDGEVTYVLKDAESPDEVYDSFELEFTNDEIVRSLKRSLPKSIGRYDHLNANPLSYSFKKVQARNLAGEEFEDIIMRIDFPEGYVMPIEPRDLDCDFWEASCEADIDVTSSTNIQLGASKEQYGITFSTSGSYIEFGVGAYIRAKYDANVGADDEYEFELKNSAYFDANLIFRASGTLEKAWESTLEITKGLEIEVSHPYSHIAKLSVKFQPTVQVGISGELNGNFVARAKSTRSGQVAFRYDSVSDNMEAKENVEYEAESLSEYGANLDVEITADAFVFPNIVTQPKLVFLRISKPLSFGEIRGGFKINSNLTGGVQSGFVVENDEYNSDLDAGISVTMDVYPLIDYKLFILFGDTEFYSMEEYAELYQGEETEIFDWSIELLETPEVIVEEFDDHAEVSFSIDANETILEHIQYKYTTDGRDPGYYVGTAWDGQAISIESSTTIKVRAMLENEDISSSQWAFGTSYSLIAEEEISGFLPEAPTASPESGTEIVGTLSVELSQENGLPIYYTVNGEAPDITSGTLYSDPIVLDSYTLLQAIAYDPDSGLYSESAVFTYNVETESSCDTGYEDYVCPSDCVEIRSDSTYQSTYSTYQSVYCDQCGESNAGFTGYEYKVYASSMKSDLTIREWMSDDEGHANAVFTCKMTYFEKPDRPQYLKRYEAALDGSLFNEKVVEEKEWDSDGNLLFEEYSVLGRDTDVELCPRNTSDFYLFAFPTQTIEYSYQSDGTVEKIEETYETKYSSSGIFQSCLSSHVESTNDVKMVENLYDCTSEVEVTCGSNGNDYMILQSLGTSSATWYSDGQQASLIEHTSLLCQTDGGGWESANSDAQYWNEDGSQTRHIQQEIRLDSDGSCTILDVKDEEWDEYQGEEVKRVQEYQAQQNGSDNWQTCATNIEVYKSSTLVAQTSQSFKARTDGWLDCVVDSAFQAATDTVAASSYSCSQSTKISDPDGQWYSYYMDNPYDSGADCTLTSVYQLEAGDVCGICAPITYSGWF